MATKEKKPRMVPIIVPISEPVFRDWDWDWNEEGVVGVVVVAEELVVEAREVVGEDVVVVEVVGEDVCPVEEEAVVDAVVIVEGISEVSEAVDVMALVVNVLV